MPVTLMPRAFLHADRPSANIRVRPLHRSRLQRFRAPPLALSMLQVFRHPWPALIFDEAFWEGADGTLTVAEPDADAGLAGMRRLVAFRFTTTFDPRTHVMW